MCEREARRKPEKKRRERRREERGMNRRGARKERKGRATLDGGGEEGILGRIVVWVVFADSASGQDLEEALENGEGRLGLLVHISEELGEGCVALGVVLLTHEAHTECLHLSKCPLILSVAICLREGLLDTLLVHFEGAGVDVEPAVLELAEREGQRRLAQAQHRPLLQHC